MKRRNLRVAEHEAVAALLKEAGEKLNAIFKALNGKVQKPMMLRVLKIDNQLFQLKSDLEDVMFRECPGDASVDIYYGAHARPTMED